jgi:hypothetical protein
MARYTCPNSNWSGYDFGPLSVHESMHEGEHIAEVYVIRGSHLISISVEHFASLNSFTYRAI